MDEQESNQAIEAREAAFARMDAMTEEVVEDRRAYSFPKFRDDVLTFIASHPLIVDESRHCAEWWPGEVVDALIVSLCEAIGDETRDSLEQRRKKTAESACVPKTSNDLFHYLCDIALADTKRVVAKWDAMTPEERLKKARAELVEMNQAMKDGV